MNSYLIIGTCAIYVLSLLVVCRAVIKSDNFSRQQKFAQIVLCLAIPIFGLILVWVFMRLDGSSPKRDYFDDQGPNA